MAPPATETRGRGSLRYEAGEGGYVFVIGDARYRVPTDGEAMRQGLLCVDGRLAERSWTPLLSEAGMLFREAGGRVLSPSQACARLKVDQFKATARGKTLTLRYVEVVNGTTLRRTVQIRLVGQTLVIQIDASHTAGDRNYCGVTLTPAGSPRLRERWMPYSPEPLLLLEGGGFAAAYVDRLKSRANAVPRGTAFYRANSLGAIAPIQETIYVTLGADPLTVLPDLPQPASPQRAALATRLLLDLRTEARYADDVARLRQLSRYGLRDLCLVVRGWRHFGDGRRLPSHYPANPERGTNEEFRGLVDFAREHGWHVALEEEYAAISDDSAYWDPRAVARLADGSFRPGARSAWAIAADKMHSFARLESLQIRRNYGPNAAFVGVHAARHPEEGLHQIDLDAGNPLSGTVAEVVGRAKQLLQFLRGVYAGPVLGEGGEGPERFDTCSAGYVDGVERTLEEGHAAPVIPDYELHRVQPRMVGYGLGRYARFFDPGGARSTVDPFQANWDAYRATEIAFGHAGFLSTRDVALSPDQPWSPLGRLDQAFAEYFLLRGLQEQYLTTTVREVAYWDGGRFVGLAEALARSLDLVNARLRIEYENGLTVWVNRHQRTEWSVSAGGTGYVLPPNGWLASRPADRFLTYSAIVPGGRADVVLSDAYRFLNARSNVARRIEGITTDGAAAIVRSAVPDRSDLYLVGGRTLAEGVDLIKASERADLSLIHTSEREVELILLDTESGRSCNITLHYFADVWQQARLGLNESVEGAWRRAPNQVQHTRRGVQIARMVPGILYRLFLP